MSKKHTLWKSLSCDLTSEEIATYSQELASVTGEQAEIEAEKKEVMSSFAAKLNKCIADGRVLARKIITKKEDRQIECDLDFDYAKGMVFTVRTDTGVTIGQRKLSDDERQQWLDLEGEQDRQQAAEEKLEEQGAPTAAPVIEGELLQIEHKAGPEVSVCGSTGCSHYDADEPNGCTENENVYECDQCTPAAAELSPECVQCRSSHPECDQCCMACADICNNQQYCLVEEAAEEKRQAEEVENDRRTGICKTWEECEHKDICFLPENEIAGVCYKDEPDKLPVEPCTDEKDGVHFDNIEKIVVPATDKTLKAYIVQLYVAKGISGNWYAAYHLHTPVGGHSYYPFPKFSDVYHGRNSALCAAGELVYNKFVEIIKEVKAVRKMSVAINDAIIIANSTEVQP